MGPAGRVDGHVVKFLLTLSVLAAPLEAQRIPVDPDWCLACSDSWQHFGSGVATDFGARLLFPRARPWQRLLLVTAIGVAWELAQADVAIRHDLRGRGDGFGPKDLLCDIAGGVLTELVWPRQGQ